MIASSGREFESPQPDKKKPLKVAFLIGGMCILTLFESNIATFNTFGLYLVQSEYLGQAVTVYFLP